MFQLNDVVVYGVEGVCEIVGFENRPIDGEDKTYFVLKPKDDRGATFYVPTWNEKALAKMRKVMTLEEVNGLIDSMPGKDPNWIANENERKLAYKRVLTGGDQEELISLIRAVYLHKKEREAEGKRLHLADEHFMNDAEQLLYHEWQYVLNVDKAGLMAYILERIENSR